LRSIANCFDVLGLPPTATPRQVAARFRRLMRELHPDNNPTAAGRRRFVQVVEAHAVLREAMKERPEGTRWALCPRCGLYGDLFEAVEGGAACSDCLLGQNYRTKFLPLPIVLVARHVAVIALYAAAILLAIRFTRTAAWPHAVTSLMCAIAGLGILAFQVLGVARANPYHRRRSLRTARSSHR
jgi:uncharacterized protein (DUF983 family)